MCHWRQEEETPEENQATRTPEKPQDDTNFIANQSKYPLDADSESILKKGLNFALTPTRIPVEDIICGVESAIGHLPPDEAEIVRQDTCRILRNATSQHQKANVTKRERIALKNLRKNEDLVILPADKGNATVLLNKEDYIRKMEEVIRDGPYRKLERDPTSRFKRITTEAIKKHIEDPEVRKKLIPQDPKTPCIYGLPKIHKENTPLRPIVSAIDAPSYKLAKYLAKILQPKVEEAQSYVKNSQHFLQIIKDIRVNREDILVSFDVASLFTNIPEEEAVKLIEEKFDKSTASLTSICLRSTFFRWRNNFYEQVSGAAMGSPISPAVANIYMEHLETVAIKNAEHKPKIWLRYIDDTFIIWTHGRQKLEDFLKYLNTLNNHIKFTMEIEKSEKLPFLDVLVKKNDDGSLGHAVYRKPTSTNRYLNANSHHHPAQLNAVMTSLIERSIRLSDSKNLSSEITNLKSILRLNGYDNGAISRNILKITHKDNRNNSKDTEEIISQKKAFLPYMKGTTDKIGNILRKFDVKAIFKPQNQVRHLLGNAKDRTPLQIEGVYEIPCGTCDKKYIGETGRTVKTRLEEHKRAIRLGYSSKSAVAEHEATGHAIDFEKSKVIAREKHFKARLIREAIEIKKNKNNYNRDTGLRISNTWNPVIHIISSSSPSSPPSSHPQNYKGGRTKLQHHSLEEVTSSRSRNVGASPLRHAAYTRRSLSFNQ